MKKVTVAALRRLLTVGTEFESHLPGARDAALTTTVRRVVSRSSGILVSAVLDGPKAGSEIRLDWAGLTVTTDGSHYYLTHPAGGGVWFARFTLRTT